MILFDKRIVSYLHLKLSLYRFPRIAAHSPAFLPQPDIDLNVPLIARSACLVGIEMLYMGSKNRGMAELALY